MKKIAILTSVFFIMTAAGTFAADQKQSEKQGSKMGAQSQQGQTGKQKLQAASDLQNFSIQSAAGEKLGKVDQVVVDLDQGKIGYVVVSSEQGEKLIVPWKAVKAEAQQQALTVQMTPDMLKQAPKGDIQQAMDQQKGREIHQFYGVSPYWEEGAQQQQQQQQPQQPQQQQQQRQPGMKEQPDTMQERDVDILPERSRPGTGM